ALTTITSAFSFSAYAFTSCTFSLSFTFVTSSSPTSLHKVQVLLLVSVSHVQFFVHLHLTPNYEQELQILSLLLFYAEHCTLLLVSFLFGAPFFLLFHNGYFPFLNLPTSVRNSPFQYHLMD